MSDPALPQGGPVGGPGPDDGSNAVVVLETAPRAWSYRSFAAAGVSAVLAAVAFVTGFATLGFVAVFAVWMGVAMGFAWRPRLEVDRDGSVLVQRAFSSSRVAPGQVVAVELFGAAPFTAEAGIAAYGFALVRLRLVDGGYVQPRASSFRDVDAVQAAADLLAETLGVPVERPLP